MSPRLSLLRAPLAPAHLASLLPGSVGARRYDALVSKSDSILAALGTLSDVEGILGLVAFGSLVRNELADSSDIDLLVVHEDSTNVAKLRTFIKNRVASQSRLAKAGAIKPIFYSADALIREIERRPSFAAHLADEGLVLYKTAAVEGIETKIAQRPITQPDLQKELTDRLSKLELFANLDRFNGQFVSCLAQLYSIGRSITIVKLLENNVHEYSWRRIFDAYSSIRPDLHDKIEHLATLRAYYDHVRNRSDLPESRHEVDPEYVDKAIDAITAVASS